MRVSHENFFALKLLLLLLNDGFLCHYSPTVLALPLTQSSDWSSVRRSLTSPDSIYLNSCSQSCQMFPGMNPKHNSTATCSCECNKQTPVFLPSAKSCVTRLGKVCFSFFFFFIKIL